MGNNDGMIITTTLALEFGQVTRLKVLAVRTGRNRSELAREALEDLFTKLGAPAVETAEYVPSEDGAHAPVN